MNKKGAGAADMVSIFIVFIVLILVVGLSLYVLNVFNTAWQDQSKIPTVSKTNLLSYNSFIYRAMDPALITWLAFLWLGGIATALLLDNNPIYLGIFLILSCITLIALIPFATVIHEISMTSASQGFSTLKMTLFLLNNIIIFGAAYIGSMLGALYLKRRYR
jgi:hypothetical protein